MSVNNLSWEEAVQWLREQPEQKELVRHCYYDDPLEQAAERFSNSEEWQEIQKLLKTYLPAKVLDLGAGRGISSYAFAKAGCTVTALEPDYSSLVGAKAIQSLIDSTNLPIQVVQEYGETLPFDDNIFDIVYGRAVLHHARDLNKLCQEVARVLKPKGVFIATREHVISKKEDLEIFLESHTLHSLYGGESAYLLQEYKKAIKDSGLKIKKIISPIESVINYAPMSKEEFENLVASTLGHRVGIQLGSWLACKKVVQQLFALLLSNKSDTPGRLYSFIAVKK
jgi:ubiquinone/menaquinone biosynthesis C-methylase UbiE